jgi:hypothetical protein
MSEEDAIIKFLLYPALFLAAGTYELAVAGMSAARLRRLRRAKPVGIRDVKQGQTVVLSGTVGRAHQPLCAPIARISCVAFSVAVPGLRGMKESVAVDFDIEDESGRAVVHAVGAQVFLKVVAPQKREFGAYDDAGDWLGNWPGSYRRPVVIVERALTTGDRIAVRGSADWRPNADEAHYRDAPLRLHIGKPARSPLLIARLA